MTLKAFAVGFPKCGTSTMDMALRRSGLATAHWKLKDRIVGAELYRNFSLGCDPMTTLPGIEAVTQADYIVNGDSFWPQMDPYLLKAIEEYHPSCHFILNMRKPEKIADSICRWNDLAERLTLHGAPGLPAGAAKDKERIVRWIERHFEFCRRFFGSHPRFVEYDIEDKAAPDIIGAALNIEIKWWGVANANRAIS